MRNTDQLFRRGVLVTQPEIIPVRGIPRSGPRSVLSSRPRAHCGLGEGEGASSANGE